MLQGLESLNNKLELRLGVVISSDLKWNSHINYVYKKEAKRLYGLRLLKRNTLPADVLLSVYCTYIRVYDSCESWHFNLPLYLSDQIENVQKRALRIIFLAMKYIDAMSRAHAALLEPKFRTERFSNGLVPAAYSCL